MSLTKVNKAIRIALLSSILLAYSSGLQAQSSASDWVSPYYRDHPLVGQVFSTKKSQWISEKLLQNEIATKQMILLGETHSNPDHHHGQASLIRYWLKKNVPTTIVFEMLTYEDWPETKQTNNNLKALTVELENVAGKWDWPIYQPILQLKIDHNLTMLGGNLSSQQLKQYSAGESCVVERKGYSLNICTSLDLQRQDRVKKLIYDAHCDYLPMTHTEPLMHVQLAKDASFAIALTQMANTHQVALIAGAIHVRKDIGVPVHLEKLDYRSFASIAFINVQAGKLRLEDYLGEVAVEQYDYIIFTPSDRNQDPCEEFAEQLKKMKRSK